jgi:hypothetical protein
MYFANSHNEGFHGTNEIHYADVHCTMKNSINVYHMATGDLNPRTAELSAGLQLWYYGFSGTLVGHMVSCVYDM